MAAGRVTQKRTCPPFFFFFLLMCPVILQHHQLCVCVCGCVFRRQEFVSRLHYHVVREYIGQLMKNNYTCKNQKHEKAATKIRQEWDKLAYLFEKMVINFSLFPSTWTASSPYILELEMCCKAYRLL